MVKNRATTSKGERFRHRTKSVPSRRKKELAAFLQRMVLFSFLSLLFLLAHGGRRLIAAKERKGERELRHRTFQEKW